MNYLIFKTHTYNEKLKLIMYKTFTGELISDSINTNVKSQREAIQTVNLLRSDLSHAHATCIVTSSLLAYKSHTRRRLSF